MDKKLLGDLGENFAERLLFGKGYDILETKFRCKQGELDIICEKAGVLCFVEVKTRQSDVMGRPCEAITTCKGRHMRKAAEYYMITRHKQNRNAQFFVVEIMVNFMKIDI